MDVLLQGLFVPLTCPFYRDGESYLRKLEHNVRRYSLSTAAGMVALPPGGEADTLTDREAAEFLRAVGQTAAPEKVLLVGVSAGGVRAALERIRVAAEEGFDAALVAPPTNWARLVRGQDARELLLFYQQLADVSPLPLVLWSDATPASLALPVEMIATLARHPNVLGLADHELTPERLLAVQEATHEVRREVTVTPVFEAVTGRMLAKQQASATGQATSLVNISNVGGAAATVVEAVPPPPAAAVKTRTKSVGFQVIAAGWTGSMLDALQAGAAAVMPMSAACAPQGAFEVYAAWKDGDPALARERAARFSEIDPLLEELGPAAVKAGCDLNGYFGGQPRLPRLPLTSEHRERVERALSALRN